jgi:PII-like signaling protein
MLSGRRINIWEDRCMSDELVPRPKAEVLAANTFGIMYGESSSEEKLGRLAALVPMALEVVDEARDTIKRLRERVEQLEDERAACWDAGFSAGCEAATTGSAEQNPYRA